MLVAGKHIVITRGGKDVALHPGEPCPEAATWPHDVLVRCMRVGQVVNVEKPIGNSPQALKLESERMALAAAKQAAPKSTQVVAAVTQPKSAPRRHKKAS